MRRLLVLTTLALLTACSQLDYSALGIHRAVVSGDQPQIDAGLIVEVDLPGHWLAAHRSTHGSSFANLVNARVGDAVRYDGVNYTVVSITTIPDSGTATYLGALVLQTSLPGDVNLLVICEPAELNFRVIYS